MWTTNGTQADWICLLANTEQDRRRTGQDVDLRANGTKGISVAQRFNKLGMRSSDTTQYFLTTCRSAANRIGEEGHGFRYQMVQFQEERIWQPPMYCGSLNASSG